jgi:hypothetical protein
MEGGFFEWTEDWTREKKFGKKKEREREKEYVIG